MMGCGSAGTRAGFAIRRSAHDIRCRQEGCLDKARWGVQVMSTAEYRVGLCNKCTHEEADPIGMGFVEPYVIPIEHCDWWVNKKIK